MTGEPARKQDLAYRWVKIQVVPPQRWTEFCRRNPADVDCRG